MVRLILVSGCGAGKQGRWLDGRGGGVGGKWSGEGGRGGGDWCSRGRGGEGQGRSGLIRGPV